MPFANLRVVEPQDNHSRFRFSRIIIYIDRWYAARRSFVSIEQKYTTRTDDFCEDRVR